MINKDSKIKSFIDTWIDYVDIIGVRPILPNLIWKNDEGSFIQKTSINLNASMLPLEKPVKNMFCDQPFHTIVIRANGKLALCCSDYDCGLDFGDYRNLYDTFMNNANLNRIRNEFRNHNLQVCKNCIQNYEIDKRKLLEAFPELRNYLDNKKVIVYGNR